MNAASPIPASDLPAAALRRSRCGGMSGRDGSRTTIKVTRDFTLNLGLRYEYNSVPTEIGNRLAGIINDPNFLGNKGLFGQMVLNPQPMYREDYKGFAPRLGMAWKVLPKTVVRGGFAIFTNLPLSQTADQQGFNFPFAGYSASPNLTFTTAPRPLNLPPLHDLSGNVVPSNGNSKSVPPNDPVNLAPYGPVETNLTSNDLHNGYTISGNLTVERELPYDTVLQAGYVFNNAVSLYASQIPNAYSGAPSNVTPFTNVNPGLGEFQLTDNHAPLHLQFTAGSAAQERAIGGLDVPTLVYVCPLHRQRDHRVQR